MEIVGRNEKFQRTRHAVSSLPFLPFLSTFRFANVYELIELRHQSNSTKHMMNLPTSKFAWSFLLLPLAVFSQPRMEQPDVRSRFGPVMFEAISFPSSDTGKPSLSIHYRINRSYFVFTKQSSGSGTAEEFIARGQLVVELLDEQKTSVAREIRPIALTRTGLPPPTERLEDIEGSILFSIRPGTYQILFEVNDLESGRSSVDKRQTVTIRRPTMKLLDFTSLFFGTIDTTDASTSRVLPFNYGTNVRYGTALGGLATQVTLASITGKPVIGWTIKGEVEDRSAKIQELKGTSYFLTDGLFSLATTSGLPVLSVQPAATSWKVLFIPLPFGQLEPGQYRLEVEFSSGADKNKGELDFKVVWPNRPMSLTNWEFAVEALRHIAKPEEIEAMESASSARGLELFREFWRKRDPDTTTAYNEVMAEYYRRVDDALREFSTMKENDGHKTDRGRIYILRGKASRVERQLQPNSPPKEIWTYLNLKKRFVFVEYNKTGNYILTETDNL